MDKPKRRYELTIKISGDTVEVLKEQLIHIHSNLWDHYRGIGTWHKGSYSAAVEHDPAMTEEKYTALLRLYLDERLEDERLATAGLRN